MWRAFFFVVHHDRRYILHFNATYHPTAEWVMQQLREASPFESAPRHLIFDRDSTFSAAVVECVKALGIEPSRTAYRSPWQNPVAERWVGTLRRELLEHVVVLRQRHRATSTLHLHDTAAVASRFRRPSPDEWSGSPSGR